MKMQTYKHHSPTNFRLVMLKRSNHVRSSLQKYFGSFGVLKHKDSTGYCLALPEQCKIHLVFNVSQLMTIHCTHLYTPVFPEIPELQLPDLEFWTICHCCLNPFWLGHRSGKKAVLLLLLECLSNGLHFS